MNSKTFFAAGLIAAAASAIKSIDDTHNGTTAKTRDLNTPRIAHVGPYWATRPYYAREVEKVRSDGASTDDDRYSSSDSDSISSSDEGHPVIEPEEPCERDGDVFACLRKQKADQCMSTQVFNADTCLCNEKYTCSGLADAYGHSTCPAQNYGLAPYTSPLDNCACQTQAEHNAMYNYEWAGHCSHAPAQPKKHPKVNKIIVCNSQTDSDSDCVRIGGRTTALTGGKAGRKGKSFANRNNEITEGPPSYQQDEQFYYIDTNRRITGSYHNKQRDDNGNVDSSIYVDSDCDPRYSSCDTNSNEEFSNTDSDTTESAKSAKKGKKADPIQGRLADRYARRYGVKLREPVPEPKRAKHGYGHGDGHHSRVFDTRSFGTDSDITSYDGSNPGRARGKYEYCQEGSCYSEPKAEWGGEYYQNEIYSSHPSKGEGYTQDENRSNVDDCDSDDISPYCNQPKPEQPESEDHHFEHVSESSGYPSRGTSNSSNSTNDPFSDSDSEGDSDDTIEPVVEEPQDDLCGQVWFEPFNGSNVWGWANLSQPGDGAYAGNTLITAKFENLEEIGSHGLHIHEFGDLSWDCKAAGEHYLPDGERVAFLEDYSTLRATWREEASYYSWNPIVKLDGETSVTGRAMVVHAKDNTRVACGIIKPGCSPCADGLCKSPSETTKQPWTPSRGRVHY